MGCFPNVNSFSERNIDGKVALVVLIAEYLHNARRKCCDRYFASSLILTFWFLLRLDKKSQEHWICGEYCLDVLQFCDFISCIF